MTYDEYLIEIGKRLTAQREGKKLTQGALKLASGVDLNTIKRLENGFFTQVHLISLLKILDVYGITLADFAKGLDCPDVSEY